nr:hypothetical protein [Tanacetum cinerariifolium]
MLKTRNLFLNPPKNCARCGHPVDGPYCQGCALLRKKLEEDLGTHFLDFQNTFESSDDSTNVVNAPREPFVVKQDHGSFIDKIICDLNKAPDSPYLHKFSLNQFYCFHCKDVLGDGEVFSNVLARELGYSQDFNFPQDFQQQYLYCDQCGGPHKTFQCQQELAEYINTLGWNRPAFYNDDDDYNSAITPVLSTEKPDNSLSMWDKHLDTIPAMKSDEVIKSSVEDLVPIASESEGIPDTMCDEHLVNNPTHLEAKDHFEIVINSNDDYSSSDDDSLYNENIEYVEASPYDSELVSLESSSTSPKSFLEETNTFDNSLLEFENFCFDLEEISSGSTTTHSNISLPDYEAFSFYDDHIEETSSGSTTTNFDISVSEYDSFIFDLSNDQFPPTDRSERKTKKDKIGTKPDKNGKRGEAWQCTSPITVEKAGKEEIQTQETNTDKS